eukprot:7211475-Prymnesium_polylepis.1
MFSPGQCGAGHHLPIGATHAPDPDTSRLLHLHELLFHFARLLPSQQAPMLLVLNVIHQQSAPSSNRTWWWPRPLIATIVPATHIGGSSSKKWMLSRRPMRPGCGPSGDSMGDSSFTCLALTSAAVAALRFLATAHSRREDEPAHFSTF